MAEVKVPALLHKMSKAAQKAWYKKNKMSMPQERSAADAKKIKPAETKPAAVASADKPKTTREVNAERQKAYYAKGGRAPIGAGGSGGSGAMAGAGQSTVKDIRAGIKAGINPKLSLDPYESERAKKVGPRSLKLKKESVEKKEEPPFTPDKKVVRRGPGGPMSQAKWLAKQAMMKKMKELKKEEVEIEEAVKDAADVGEYDYEGDMAKSQLRSILANAKRMHDMLEDNTNLPEWVQSKITLAEDYISTASNYMQGEMNEEVEQVDEKAPPGAKFERMVKHIKKGYAKDGLTPKEKSIAYATAWKAYGKKEEVVTEAEGTVAVTPKEKALAAHHGDPKKITYGDVIKARLKSAAAKKMGK